MSLSILGLNHRTAQLELREKLAFTPDTMSSALQELRAVPDVEEAMILSTCNRTELYLSHQRDEAVERVLEWLCQWHQVDRKHIRDALYWRTGTDAIRHAIEVASGLDSMVLGETEILGQFKQASRDADAAGTLGSQLHSLTQQAFSTAKEVRTNTEISRNPVSLAHAAVSLTQQFFDRLQDHRALVVGAGETAQLVARYLHDRQIGHLTIANRSLDRAQALARELLAHAIPISHMEQALKDADIVVSSTNSPLPILGKGRIEGILRQRKHQPLYMVDLAVPRDIEPQIGELPDVYLYTLDDLRRVVEENLKSRERAREEANAIIARHVEACAQRERGESAFDLIREYRASSQQWRDQTLAQARRRLAQGQSPNEVLEWLSHTLCNRLMHAPTQTLNQAGQDGDEALLQAMRRLLDLDPSES